MADETSFIGRQIGGNYRILTELNSGSFGTVYLGRHLIFEDSPTVAIKLLHAHLRSTQERAQFIQEAQLLKKLNHSYILRIIDAGFENGASYLVTEYASHGSLRDRLNQQAGKPLPLNEALTILSQIGQALHYAHQAKPQAIVHRDLKPENILFNERNEALLADFGIAVVLEKTKRVDIVGTPAYMAPEQFQGEISQKSDQYALGCIAYELVTGRKAFTAPDFFSMAFKHLNEYPPAPTQFNPLLPVYVEQAIFKAIVKYRTERHTDVSAFISVLQKTATQWLDEGLTHYKAKRHEEALAAYEQALRLDPNFALAYNGKSFTLKLLGKTREAQQAYDKAKQLGYSG